MDTENIDAPLVQLKLYEHDEVCCAASPLNEEADDLCWPIAYGWDYSEGDVLEAEDGTLWTLVDVGNYIQTGDANGNYILADAANVDYYSRDERK